MVIIVASVVLAITVCNHYDIVVFDNLLFITMLGIRNEVAYNYK